MSDHQAAVGETGRKISVMTAESRALDAEDTGILNKIELLATRVRSIDSFLDLSFSEFVRRMPNLEQLFQMLSQSVINTAYGLLRRNSSFTPQGACDIVSSSEKLGLLPFQLAAPLANFLAVAENGFDDLGSNDVTQIQKDLPRTKETLLLFLDCSHRALRKPKKTA